MAYLRKTVDVYVILHHLQGEVEEVCTYSYNSEKEPNKLRREDFKEYKASTRGDATMGYYTCPTSPRRKEPATLQGVFNQLHGWIPRWQRCNILRFKGLDCRWAMWSTSDSIYLEVSNNDQTELFVVQLSEEGIALLEKQFLSSAVIQQIVKL